ncbi:DNA adenine methylase [Clostridium carnis]
MRSPIKWVGGKSKSLKYLIPLIPSHEGYVEVFGGAGWLLFAKTPSKWEVINDLDENLSNLWVVLKEKEKEFIDSFKYEVISRSIFNNYKEIYKNKSYIDNVNKAHILYYLLKAGTGASLPDGGGCGFGKSKGVSRLRLDKLSNDIAQAHNRLLKVTIECKDFREIISYYDTENTFFYLDPPYRNTSRSSYPVGKFTDEDYTDLSNLCKNIKGKFLLSINDDDFIKYLFANFNIRHINIPYSGSNQKTGRENYPELIISNYTIN